MKRKNKKILKFQKKREISPRNIFFLFMFIIFVIACVDAYVKSPNGITIQPIAGLPVDFTIGKKQGDNLDFSMFQDDEIPTFSKENKNIFVDDRIPNLKSEDIDFNKITDVEFKGLFTLPIYDDVAKYYINLPRYWDYDNEIQKYINDEYNFEFINYTVKHMNEALKEAGFSEGAIVSYWIKFVQNIPYAYDTNTSQYDDWPQYPIETLYKKSGDCEDHSILLLTILKALNYDCAAIFVPEHAAVGLSAVGLDGFYYKYKDRKYYYIEATGIYEIGDVPENIKKEPVKIIPIS